MTVRGKEEGASTLCTAVTAREFVMLARDVLVMRGHTRIRITDGPGDGFRDIHSLDAKGHQHVTQVAHTQDPTKTLDTRKLGELPGAIMKFGAKAGLFITTGRISPQGKREFLGDYPGMDLDFLDGDSLADEILRNVPLKAVWYDGVQFGRVANRIRVAFLLRDLATDRPLRLTQDLVAEPWPRFAEDLEIVCREEWVHASTFNPYRQPESADPFEGISARTRVHEIVIGGLFSLDLVQQHQKGLGAEILARVRRISDSPLLALRFGQPLLVPLRGEWSGSSVQVGPAPFTLLATPQGIVDEWTWLLDVDDVWGPPRGVRHANSEWVRRLHAEHDLVFAVNLTTTSTDESRWHTASITRVIKRDWDRSVFCLIERDRVTEFQAMELPPTETHRWIDGREFLIWSLRALVGPFAITASADRADDEDVLPIVHRERAALDAFAKLRKDLEAARHDLVGPRQARHMRALVDTDPYPTDEMLYRFVDLERGTPYPSPVDPRGRWLTLDVCWRFDIFSDQTRRGLEAWIEAWSEAAPMPRSAFVYELDQDEYSPGRPWFVRLQVIEVGCEPLASTKERLRAFTAAIVPKLTLFQDGLESRGLAATRATRDYWSTFCDLEFVDPQ